MREPTGRIVGGARAGALDPSDAKTLYAAAFGTGVWRSLSGGAFTQIKAPLSTANVHRSEFSVTALANSKTRMYVGDGNMVHAPGRGRPVRIQNIHYWPGARMAFGRV